MTDRIDDEALPVLRQRLLNLKLFSEVAVEKRPEATLVVTAKERWTLIPIPVLAVDDSGLMGGLAIVESNLFGRRKLLALSGIYGERKKLASLIYRDPELFGARAVLAVDLLAEDMLRERAEGST